MKKIYIITPSSNIKDEIDINSDIKMQIKKAENVLSSIGVEIIYGNLFYKSYRWYGGKINERVNEIHTGFEKNNIDFLMTSQGGYNVNSLLDKLDYNLIKNNYKPLIGLSDTTILLNAIYKKTGHITYHGYDFIRQIGKSAGTFSKLVLDNFFNKGNLEDNLIGESLNNVSQGKGILIGGCLPSYSLIVGSEYDPIELNKEFIFFIEDIGENYERIISYIDQLLLNNKFKINCKGFVIGNFSFCSFENNKDYDFNQILKEKLDFLKIPILKINNIGHIVENPILPIGQEVEIENNLLKLKVGI